MVFENIFLGLGSNKGDRLSFLKQAVKLIDDDELTGVKEVSSVYETEPYGYKEQGTFLNAVIKISTQRVLKELCPWIKSLEKKIGRIPAGKWEAREIDIDILFFGKEIYDDGKLIVPHKEFLLRDFVIIPMIEIAPEFEHPVTKNKMREIETNHLEKLIVRKFKTDLLK